jgi:hypothetical protein
VERGLIWSGVSEFVPTELESAARRRHIMKKVVTIVFAMALALAVSTSAAAQEIDVKVLVTAEVVKGSTGDHFVTFNAPVGIPEVTLPAGTYVFSFVAPSVVQVSSPDRRQRYAMFFTSPIERAVVTDQYDMTIVPTTAAAPARIAAWFLPNQTRGFEFLYRAAEGDTGR